MNYSSLLAIIAANVYTNHNNEVTAEKVKAALDSCVSSLGAGYQSVGVATEGTTPGTPDARVYYFAPPGTYKYFDNITAPEYGLLYWDTEWHFRALGLSINQTIIEGNVTNNPDNEDLTSENNKLKFANRTSGDGMNYVILRTNASFASQLTLTNCIYEIRYDFDLGGASVTIPTGCVLRFVGGSISNGSITLNGAEIDGDRPCFRNCDITKEAHLSLRSSWFDDGADDSPLLYKLFLAVSEGGCLTIDRDMHLLTPLHFLSPNYADGIWLKKSKIVGDFAYRTDVPQLLSAKKMPAFLIDFEINADDVFPVYIASEQAEIRNIDFRETIGLVGGNPSAKFTGPVVRFTTPSDVTSDLDILIDNCSFLNIKCDNKLQLDGRGPRVTNCSFGGYQRGVETSFIKLVGRNNELDNDDPTSPQHPTKSMRAVRIDHNRFHGGAGVLLEFVQDPGSTEGHEDTTYYNVDIHNNYSDSGSLFLLSSSKMNCVNILNNNLTMSYFGSAGYYLCKFTNDVENINFSNNIVTLFKRTQNWTWINTRLLFQGKLKDLIFKGNLIKGDSKAAVYVMGGTAKGIVIVDNIFSEGATSGTHGGGGDNGILSAADTDVEDVVIMNNVLNLDGETDIITPYAIMWYITQNGHSIKNCTLAFNKAINNSLLVVNPYAQSYTESGVVDESDIVNS